jgi:hypothetical protein
VNLVHPNPLEINHVTIPPGNLVRMNSFYI